MSYEDLIESVGPHEVAIKRGVKEETGLEISEIVVVHIASGKTRPQAADEILSTDFGDDGGFHSNVVKAAIKCC